MGSPETNLKVLDNALVELGRKAGKKALLGALRDAVAPARRSMRKNAPEKSGTLKKSIKAKAQAGKQDGGFTARIQVGVFGSDAYYAKFIEQGTKAHSIPKRKRHKNGKRKVIKIGDNVVDSVEHPGLKEKPFILPAFEQTHQQCLERFKKRLLERVIVESIKHARN